ncbi:MAG: hypothetical protein PHQ66_02670 [Candidatus Nanoarchaeia archaeon]|nr:hypothetical protein [Candidatus Nanoarchaeia archaeon]MDD5357729.1 hypothetical protein [Candidatus Nanoarchaeia archaeon]MDD5588648.1 hypothetical protein [Candidatus Nanoarchaeia archaeon]
MGRKNRNKKIIMFEGYKLPKIEKGFEIVYDYKFEERGIYPSFKILYDAPKLLMESDEKRLKKCIYDILFELTNGEYKEIKKIIDTRSKKIESENDTAMGIFDNRYDRKIDKHLFYKISLDDKVTLEIEDYKPKRIDKFSKKEKKTYYFEDSKLNEVIDKFRFNPNNISVFVARQIEFGGDRLFEEIYGLLGGEI